MKEKKMIVLDSQDGSIHIYTLRPDQTPQTVLAENGHADTSMYMVTNDLHLHVH